ncbi:LacI family transcriptional regulator [Burkholderia cepacia]|uniref:LacI family transcriptional regulator n=1 Tax=Burkholderia cepacia TaxID=292 RepID=A0A103Z9Q2_BURCE|nr:substrate-binding domain-containing protein [Burkholderia cepacia]KVK76055.1 LacI family transcriptional regulator [Burkholderia cepacia]
MIALAVPAGAGPVGDTRQRIGAVLPGSSLFYWQVMRKGIEQAARDLHVDLLMRSPADGASIDGQPNIQLKMIDYLVRNGVAGILLAAEPLRDAVAPVAVPVVQVDRLSRDYPSVSIVSTNNLAAGKVAAMTLAPVLRQHAKVAILRLSPEIGATTERENGFASIAHEKGWNVTIDAYVGFRPHDAEVRIARIVSDYDGRLDAIFAPAEPIAYGALRVIRTLPPERRPRLVVFDWRPEFEDGLRSGEIHADIVQDPYRMGYLGLEVLVGRLNGHASASVIYIPTMTLTRDNVDSPASRKILDRFSR